MQRSIPITSFGAAQAEENVVAKNTMKRTFPAIAIGTMLAIALLLTGTATADAFSNDGVGGTRCEAHVTLSASDQPDINMSLNLVFCGKVDEPGVFDRVKGNGFYTIGDSESTGGRLVVTGGHYTNVDTDDSKEIVVSVKSGPLKGSNYELRLTTINGCTISGRWALEGSSTLNSLTGRTNCTNSACVVD